MENTLQFWPEVELFEWEGVLSIREKVSRKTVLTIYRTHCMQCGNTLDSREYWFRERMQKVVGPKLVELMNQAIKSPELVAPQSIQAVQESPVVTSNGNGHTPAKRRGNPNWIKGMKKK